MNLLSIIAQRNRSAGASYDPDAAAWFAALVSAGSSISAGNMAAVSAFVAGCKADASPIGGVSNWGAIKECCLLCAANDLTGALIPLKGGAPTNNGFVSGDYSRLLGLTGNGTSKYLISSRNNNADPQDNNHNAAWSSQLSGIGTASRFMGSDNSGVEPGQNQLVQGAANDSANPRFRCRTSNVGTLTVAAGTGMIGMSRHLSGSYIVSAWGASATITEPSVSPVTTGKVGIFATATAAAILPGRQSYYSIGEAVDLALLRARLTTLMAALT